MRLALAIPLIFSITGFAKEIDNPLYRDWASHRVGTVVKYSIVTIRNGYRMEVQRSARLLAILTDKVVLEESAAMEAGDSNVDFPASKTEVAARIESAQEAVSSPPIAQGRENLTVGKESYSCAWTDLKSQSATTKRWTCERIPGGLVREEIARIGGELLSTTTMLVRFEEGPPPAPAVTFNTNFEGASIGTIEKLDETTFRAHVAGQYDERGRNRQATWYFFRMDHAKGREIVLTLMDFVGEYNDKPGSCPMSDQLRPVFSEDGLKWKHFESGEWDNAKKEYTLRFKPAADSIYIAHIPPYTNSNLRKLLMDMGRRATVNVEVIGKTVANRDLHLITVTNPDVGDGQKKVVWLIARQHAWEAGTSWNMDGAVRFISSDDAKAKALRDQVVFKFVPMMDPDGVFGGKVRFNGNGYDVNRHWNEVDLRRKEILALMPEIWYVKKAIVAQMQSGRPIELMVNLHNTETGEYQETIADDAATQKMMQRFFDGLSANSAFLPSRPLVFSTAPATTTNVMWVEKKVPVMLMEQRISTNKKLGRFPTIADRLEFGAALAREMAAAVLAEN